MTSQEEEIFSQHGVFIHTSLSRSPDDAPAELLGGSIRIMMRHKELYLEWTPVDNDLESPTVNTSDFAKIGAMKYTRQESGLSVNVVRRYTISFSLNELNSIETSKALGTSWVFFTFILKDGTTHPAVHFHDGGSDRLLDALAKCGINLVRSLKNDNVLLVKDLDRDALHQTLMSLNLMQETSGSFATSFAKKPVTSTWSALAKVSNFFLEAVQNPAALDHVSADDMQELMGDSYGHMYRPFAADTRSESTFEVVDEVALPVRRSIELEGPVTLDEWLRAFNAEGRVISKEIQDKLLNRVFYGGLEADVRSQAWRFILGYYSWTASDAERDATRQLKIEEYFIMKRQWQAVTTEQEKRWRIFRERRQLVEKDVNRTDRLLAQFKEQDGPLLVALHDILMTYIMYDFDLGYVQGMNDLLAPLLSLIPNEADAFWCFVGSMNRVRRNFDEDQAGTKLQLSQIFTLLSHVDPELCEYLESHDSGNLFFCFRWLLVWFKRDFTYKQTERLWEALWTGRPCENFHLLICLSLILAHKDAIIENEFGLGEILKRVNDMAGHIELEGVFTTAIGVFQQLRDCPNLPPSVAEILGLKVSVADRDVVEQADSSSAMGASTVLC